MKLTQDTLSKYFTLSHSDVNGFFSNSTDVFNFINRNSQTLLVTIGDSYTYGYDLPLHLRVNQVYGSVLSKNINSDWLNLGLPSSGNFYLTKKVEELSNIIPDLEYDKIYVICTFTEVGRWFNTEYDRHINYINWFKDNVESSADFNKLLVMLNHDCVQRIQTALEKFKHVELRVGTNFVDQIGFDNLTSKQLLPTPWYQLLGKHDSNNVYVCSAGAISINQAKEFIPIDKHDSFKEWLNKVMDLAYIRLGTITNPKIYRGGHPFASGHQVWANYILDNL